MKGNSSTANAHYNVEWGLSGTVNSHALTVTNITYWRILGPPPTYHTPQRMMGASIGTGPHRVIDSK